MNGNDQITLEKVDRKLTTHIEVSERQAEEVTTFMRKVNPILEEYHDKIAVKTYLRGRWKVVVGILTVLAFIGSIKVAILSVVRSN